MMESLQTSGSTKMLVPTGVAPERAIAERLLRIAAGTGAPWPGIDVERALAWVPRKDRRVADTGLGVRAAGKITS